MFLDFAKLRNSVEQWELWPSRRRSLVALVELRAAVWGSKTSRNQRNPNSWSVQPLGETATLEKLYKWFPACRGRTYVAPEGLAPGSNQYDINLWPLNMTIGCNAPPVAKIHSITVTISQLLEPIWWTVFWSQSISALMCWFSSNAAPFSSAFQTIASGMLYCSLSCW